jgi:uncharacterized integral membrane protein
MMILRGLFVLFLTGGAIGFALYNDQAISMHYYFDWVSIPLPLFLWFFLAFWVGLLIASVIGSVNKFSLQARLRHQRALLAQLERERHELQMRRASDPQEKK